MRPISTVTVYNLGIRSSLPLPELPEHRDAPADVEVRVGPIDYPLPQPIRSRFWFQRTEEATYLCWPGFGAFHVRNGREITVDPAPEVTQQVIRILLLGPVMAVLLQQRGFLVLHASAVNIGGSAVAFLGDKGCGKSTLSAALYARGHGFLADDVVAVDTRGDGAPMVLPGLPQFKLWPEAVTASLGDDPQKLPPLLDGYEKRVRPVSDRCEQAASPLRYLYVLDIGSPPRIETYRPLDGMLQLVRHSYNARHGKRCFQDAEASTHFLHCTSLARRIPICRLTRNGSLATLPDLVQTVEAALLPRGVSQPHG